MNSLIQRGPTILNYGPFYRNSRATSNKMMCKTTDSH